MRYVIFSGLIAFALGGCMAPSKPQIHFASENSISLKYSAYGFKPTVSAEALDMAISHCASHGKGMKLVTSNAMDGGLTAREMHTFMCTNDFPDETIQVNVN